MQVIPRPMAHPPPVKIYNAVYSSVQVYECMVRGIAVMRRRVDSYVNATQILKVAGVDKGRRTKILEKEILPGKHEIVQGGYGKYQGTWIPLERGRDVAIQYGVAPLLSPLFDFVPNAGPHPAGLPNMNARNSPRPLSAAPSLPGLGPAGGFVPQNLAPPPIMPGSALRLLNQGRAQGLFTPSTSSVSLGRPSPGMSPTPAASPNQQSLKRSRTDTDIDFVGGTPGPSFPQGYNPGGLAASPDIQMADGSRSSAATPQLNGDGGPHPAKRPRTNASPPPQLGLQRSMSQPQMQIHDFANYPPTRAGSRAQSSTPLPPSNGTSRPASATSGFVNGKSTNGVQEPDSLTPRFASKPSIPRNMDRTAPAKDAKRGAIAAAICSHDDPTTVLKMLREMPGDDPALGGESDIDLVLDEQGHTALHIAASMAQYHIVEALLVNGADMHRGNYNGETPLIRACLATSNADQQTFHTLVNHLHASIRTLDTARRSVLHHIVSLAGVKNRAIVARYYLDQIFYWVAQHQGGEFRSLVDLQDEHGDTVLNIAARVGNRSLVRTLLDVGANRVLPNKLGLRPGDFGVETEELGGGPRAEDLLASLRSVPSAPVQKSQDVIADMTAMISNLSAEFSVEIKTKQDALDLTQAHLRAATRELADQRRQIQTWQARCGELDQVTQRARNLDKALIDEVKYDWTGGTDLEGLSSGTSNNGVPFQFTDTNSSVDVAYNLDEDPPMPIGDSVASLIRLRRLKQWHIRTEELINSRLKSLQGASAEKEFQCKKIVALCTGVPIDKIEAMLENLVIAVESEAQIVDIGRVSGFMQKVRDGVI